MSKAFAGESDEGGEIPDGPSWPSGVRNYMTAAGAVRLRARIQGLNDKRRESTSGVEAQARQQKLERELRYWLERLEVLESVDPLTQSADRVLFGATVTLSDEKEKLETWRIVGVDEADLPKRWISWMSPLATILLNKGVGEKFSFLGRSLMVRAIHYEA